MMWTVTFRMLAVLAFLAFVSIPSVQSKSNGLKCLEQNHQGGKSCNGGLCFRSWESAKGNDSSYFCAKDPDENAAQIMMPLLQKLQTTSEEVTVKVGVDLDGTIVSIDGTIDPKTISNAKSNYGISLDIKLNGKIDQVTLTSKASGFLSFNKIDLEKLGHVQLCSGQNCRALDPKGLEENLIEHKKVTVKFGNAITMEISVQGDIKNLLEKAKKNEKVDIGGTFVFKVDNSEIKMVIQGNTEKIEELSKLGSELELYKHLNIAASICIGTECFHAGACSTNLCNTKENLLEITALNSARRICDFKQILLCITLLLALWW